MQEIIFGLVSFVLAGFAFGFGAFRLFRRKKPLYLQLLVCAVGCFALQRLSGIVNLWCGVTETVSVGMLGIFGCNFFLFSANYGTLDGVVDDGRESKKARVLAIIAPVVTAMLAAAAFLVWKERDMFSAVMWLVMYAPALPASYFNLKHIFLPMDPFEFLRATRPGNIAALVFYTVTAAYIIGTACAGSTVSGILSILMSLSAFSLTLSAIEGGKRWGI